MSERENRPHDPDVTSDVPSPVADSAGAPDALRTTDDVRGPASTDGSHPLADAAADDLPPVPGYRVLREIARGGMGRVLAARDLALGRDVALKTLLPGANPARFVRESKITARLPHPGIPPVHALGTLADGSPFLAMKLIAGRTLADEMKTADRPRLLQAFTQVCQAVGFAHSRGIIHRDLKPANVMVGAFGEVQVMDWGLAKEVGARGQASGGRDQGSGVRNQEAGGISSPTPDTCPPTPDSSERTQAGQVMGTPAYMPPEQARGEPTDARSDVFALGGILCEILTGRPPFGGKSSVEVIRRAAAADLADANARLESCGADAELVALCRRCLSPRAADRFADGQAAAGQMTAYLDGVQERLRRAELAQAEARAKAAEEAKRRRLKAALAAALAALLLGGGAFAWWQSEQAAAQRATGLQRQLEDEQRSAADRDRRGRNAEAVDALLSQGAEALKAGDTPKAQVALEAARKRSAEGGAEPQSQRLERLGADLVLLRDLNAVDQSRWTPVAGKFPDRAAMVRQLREALARFGADPEATSEDEAAARVSASAMRERIVTALDLLLVLRPSAQVHALLRRVDADPYRDAVRDALLAGPEDGRAKLVELGNQKAALEQPPGFAAVLGQHEDIDAERRRQLLQAALSRRPNDLPILMTLGLWWEDKNDTNECLRWFQAAVAAAPDNIAALNNLGAELNAKGQADEAIDCYRKVIALDPDGATPYMNLGNALHSKGQVDEAIACYRKAIDCDPTYPKSYYNLGRALEGEGRVDEAIACFEKALVLDPDYALALSGLGRQLLSKGRVDEAIGCWKKVLTLPDQQGLHADARVALAAVEALAAVQDKLPALLKGDYRPRSNGERLSLVKLCQFKKLYRTSAGLYADAFAADTKLAEDLEAGHRYDAACFAALAAAGQGEDAAGLDDKERARLRRQALDWLRADLALWTKQLESGQPADRTAVRQTMEHWQGDTDLDGLRDKAALGQLPPDERKAFTQMWADVAALLKKAEAPAKDGER